LLGTEGRDGTYFENGTLSLFRTKYSRDLGKGGRTELLTNTRKKVVQKKECTGNREILRKTKGKNSRFGGERRSDGVAALKARGPKTELWRSEKRKGNLDKPH